MSLAHKNGAGLEAVNESQKGERSGLKLKPSNVHVQREVFAAVRSSEPDVA
jgi:hypothetical protein